MKAVRYRDAPAASRASGRLDGRPQSSMPAPRRRAGFVPSHEAWEQLAAASGEAFALDDVTPAAPDRAGAS